jgi:uncharacterized protein (UPF0261 family)
MPATVLLIATLDTKGEEIAWIRERIKRRGHRTLVLDAGVLGAPAFEPDVPASDVADAGGTPLTALRDGGDRGRALDVMARGTAVLARRLHGEGRFDAALGIGGSCGTAIATAAMRELPIGLPKVMVSTVASGQVAPYVGVSDIAMLYPVVDVAGLNRISRRILTNAAGAICGMLEEPAPERADKPLLAATMFGVTTPCVERVRKRVEEAGYEMLVFHATGSGGRAMEALVAAGFVMGVADVTTTEWADELVGGVLSAGPDRLDAAGRAGIPQVVSVGALDMVNCGPRATVPERVAATAEESARLGEIIAAKLNRATGPVTLLLPLRGVSAIDREGQPFHDPAADTALFDALRRHVADAVVVRELDLHINDPEFADDVAATLLASLAKKES